MTKRLTTRFLALLTILFAPLALSAAPDTTINAGQAVSLSVSSDGTAPFNYSWTKDGVAISGATSGTFSIAAFSAANAGVYQSKVSNSAGSTLTDTVKLILAIINAPVITTQPLSQTKNVGDSISISVVATGTGPLTYQWRLNGVNLPGFTSNTFADPKLDVTDAGSYTCAITNSGGTTISNAAILTIVSPPSTATLKITVGP